jgi:DNA topoisomerase IA
MTAIEVKFSLNRREIAWKPPKAASLARLIDALSVAGIGRVATDHSPFGAKGGLAAR